MQAVYLILPISLQILFLIFLFLQLLVFLFFPYNIQRYIEFTDEHGNIKHLEPFRDGSHIIYINGEYKDTSNELGKIIHDFHCVKSTEMLCEELKKPAEYLKNKKKGDNEMFELYNF